MKSSLKKWLAVAVAAATASLSLVVEARPLGSSRFPMYRCQNHTEHFNDPSVIVNLTTWDGDARSGPKWISEYNPSHVVVGNGTARLWLQPYHMPNDFGRAYGWPVALTSSMWIGQGKICSRLMAGRGGGIVTAFMMATYVAEHEVDDELDWEIVGKPEWLYEAQSNYFALGRLNYNNSQHHLTETDVAGNFQTYCFERTKDKITWSLNNQTVRTIVREARNSTTFPYRDEHRLSKVAISFWDGGSGSEGTSLWSGGPTDWETPHNDDYRLLVDWISVECYDNEGVNPATVSSFLPPLSTPRTRSITVAATTSSSVALATATSTELAEETSVQAASTNTVSQTRGDPSSGAVGADWSFVVVVAAQAICIGLLLSGLAF